MSRSLTSTQEALVLDGLAKGKPIRVIAREMEVSRNSVRRRARKTTTTVERSERVVEEVDEAWPTEVLMAFPPLATLDGAADLAAQELPEIASAAPAEEPTALVARPLYTLTSQREICNIDSMTFSDTRTGLEALSGELRSALSQVEMDIKAHVCLGEIPERFVTAARDLLYRALEDLDGEPESTDQTKALAAIATVLYWRHAITDEECESSIDLLSEVSDTIIPAPIIPAPEAL